MLPPRLPLGWHLIRDEAVPLKMPGGSLRAESDVRLRVL
jgi:hypothetical protein